MGLLTRNDRGFGVGSATARSRRNEARRDPHGRPVAGARRRPALRAAARADAARARIAGLCGTPDYGGQHEYEHAGTTRAHQLRARRARRPPLFRKRSQRAALHPQQAEADVHDVSRLQRPRRTSRSFSEVHLRAQLRHRSHQLHLRSRLRKTPSHVAAIRTGASCTWAPATRSQESNATAAA